VILCLNVYCTENHGCDEFSASGEVQLPDTEPYRVIQYVYFTTVLELRLLHSVQCSLIIHSVCMCVCVTLYHANNVTVEKRSTHVF
jgi:hypothetical protein